MKRILAALGWAGLFTVCGAALFVALTLLITAPHTASHQLLLFLGAVGAAEALIPWCLCLCFAALPGALPTLRPPKPFSLSDGIGALFGAGLLMAVAGALPMLLPLNYGLLNGLHTGRLKLPDFHSPLAFESAVLAGELTAALWLSWLMRRLGQALCGDGSPSGIGWRPASGRAYGFALILAFALITSVILLLHALPPDAAKLETMNAAKLFSGPLWALGGILATIFILAPIVEEILFRGFVFAGFAAKWGPGWATILSSLIFITVHAPEKIHYLPGFLDVALLALAACWLRLRCQSIRPGILLHITYNTGLLLAGPLLH